MAYKPVVSKTELATIARCPKCRGASFFVVDRFMQPDDHKDLGRLKKLGFKAESGALCQLQRVEFCGCSQEEVTQPAKICVLRKFGAREILSLKRTKEAPLPMASKGRL